MIRKTIFVVLMIIGLTSGTSAWVYPEHRDITLRAIQKLDSAHRIVLEKLWELARKGYETRLDAAVADISQGVEPKQLDYAAWPAIAGDHSTSAENMINNILHTDWILGVANIAARLKDGIAASKTKSVLESKLRSSDLQLLRVDPEYVSRAGSNNVHFMLARPDVNTSAATYFESCFREGSEVNLIGTYTWFHTSAMLKAMRLVTETLTSEQRSSLAMALLADEAFALHFLEDGFSAGHVAGIWGNAALRKGTHDYYDERGLEVTTWQGNRLILTGDAYMRAVDCERAANTVQLSMEQLLDAASGKIRFSVYNDQSGIFTPDKFNIAKNEKTPRRITDPDLREMFRAILITTPVPGLSTGLGEIPRFRSELGPFIGIAPAGSTSVISGGFGLDQKTPGFVPGLELAIHMGLGMDGVLNQSGDGLVFLDLGLRLDGASSVKIRPDPSYKEFGSILSAIPSREAFYARLRLPYYVIPGDLLVMGPILALFSPKSLNKVMTTTSQGGLIPWQTGLITPIGRFQFMLGREVGVYFFGSVQGADAFLFPDANLNSNQWSLISMHTTKLEFPFLEYRPLRTFSRKQSASLLLQFFTGVDIPGKVTMKTTPEADAIHLKPTWSIGIRLGFDWRYYFAGKKS